MRPIHTTLPHASTRVVAVFAGLVALSSCGADSKHSSSSADPIEPSGAPPLLTTLSVPVTKEFPNQAPTFNVHRPTDLREPGFRLPVIVWANGGCFRSDFTWTPLFERWAAAGFVVLSLTDQTGSGGAGGNILDQLGAILAGQTSASDHRALIDWVVAQNENGPYKGLLDLHKIVIAGNSCGGVTAMEAAAQDERVAAVFVLSGSSAVGSVNEQVVHAIRVPVGFIVGGEQDVAAANALGDFQALNDGVPGLLVRRFEGDHITVSTDPLIAPSVAEIALNWMDLALYGRREAYVALTSANVCDHCAQGEWSIMERALKGLVK